MHLIDSLKQQQELSKSIRKMLLDTLNNKIKKEDLTATVSVLNSLRSSNVEQLLSRIIIILDSSVAKSRIKEQSKNVYVKFDKQIKNVRKSVAIKE